MEIFRNYDIRGRYPEDIGEKNIPRIMRAVYRLFRSRFRKRTPVRVVVGYDMRKASPLLAEAARRALVSCGAQVLMAGQVSTPSLYFAVRHYGHDAGIQITASHMPPEFTGIKFVLNSRKGLLKVGRGSGMEQIERYAQEH